MIKLVLCDMDGTLKPFGRDRVSERSVSAIHELRDAGIQFGPATGREAVDLYPFFGGDGSCFATGILANGKQVYVDGELVLERPLDLAALKRLEAYCLDNPDFALIVYVPTSFPARRSARWRHTRGARGSRRPRDGGLAACPTRRS